MRVTPIELVIDPREKTYWLGIFTAHLQNGTFYFLEIGWLRGQFIYSLISYEGWLF